MLQIDGSGIRRMFDIGASKQLINMALGEPHFDVPAAVKRACMSAMLAGKNKYTQNAGIVELRRAVARKLKHENRIRANENQVIVTCGALGGLSIIFQTLFQKGDEVILFDPYFVAYERLVRLNGATPVFVDTYPDFTLDAEKIRSKITERTKAIILNNPCNPTGRVFSREELKAVADVAREHDLVIISDEVYEKFVYDGEHLSIGRIYPKTVTVNGFSKSHAMTGWRIGYVHGPQEIMEHALKAQQFNFTCAPAPFQYAAMAALKTPVRKHVAMYKKKRNVVWNGLKDNYEFQKPAGAFFAFIRAPIRAQDFVQRCMKKRLIVVPGNTFSQRDTHFRLSFACPTETLEKGISVLNSLCRE